MNVTTANDRLATYFCNLLSDPNQVRLFAADLDGSPADLDDARFSDGRPNQEASAMVDTFGDVFAFIGHVQTVDQVDGTSLADGAARPMGALGDLVQRASGAARGAVAARNPEASCCSGTVATDIVETRFRDRTTGETVRVYAQAYQAWRAVQRARLEA